MSTDSPFAPSTQPMPEAAPRKHRRFEPRRPAAGKRRPPVADATAVALRNGLARRHGALYTRFCKLVPVAGYVVARVLGRVRRWRMDGAQNVLCVLQALIYGSDIRTGFIGRPRPGGGQWERFGLEDLAHFAFGTRDAAVLRTTARALRVIEAMGFVSPAVQIRKTVADGEIRSENAVRRLNWHRLAEACGTLWHLARDRVDADRRQGARGPEQGGKSKSKQREPRPRRGGWQSALTATGFDTG